MNDIFNTNITYSLDFCNCTRTVPYSYSDIVIKDTTCGLDSFRRGAHQKVVSFSFFIIDKKKERKRGYFAG